MKLEEFLGATTEIDTKTSALLGKLLIDEAEEDVNPDGETYGKLFALLGGPLPVILFVIYAQFQKFFDNHVERVNAEYSIIDPEKQQDLHA